MANEVSHVRLTAREFVQKLVATSNLVSVYMLHNGDWLVTSGGVGFWRDVIVTITDAGQNVASRADYLEYRYTL